MLNIRDLFTAMLAEIPAEERTDDPYGEELCTVFAVVLHAAADCLRAFGSLVVAEAEQREGETDKALAESLDIFRETQAFLGESILVDAQDNSARLLRGSILAGLEQLLARLNLQERPRAPRQWIEQQLRRPLAQLPPIIQAVLPHPERPYLRGLPSERPAPASITRGQAPLQGRRRK